jgi:hypothetical protein
MYFEGAFWQESRNPAAKERMTNRNFMVMNLNFRAKLKKEPFPLFEEWFKN